MFFSTHPLPNTFRKKKTNTLQKVTIFKVLQGFLVFYLHKTIILLNAAKSLFPFPFYFIKEIENQDFLKKNSVITVPTQAKHFPLASSEYAFHQQP